MSHFSTHDQEPTLSSEHVIDAGGRLAEMTTAVLAENGQSAAPDTDDVPRPVFADTHTALQVRASELCISPPESRNGRLQFEGVLGNRLLSGFEGLRGYAMAKVPDSDGNLRSTLAPAIVLPGARQLAILTAENPPVSPARITPLQHTLLETTYVAYAADVQAAHRSGDTANVGQTAPGLVVASTLRGADAHNSLHGLAVPALGQAGGSAGAFGTNFHRENRQDFMVDGQTRRVLSAVIPMDKARFMAGEHDQLLPGQSILVSHATSAGRLAIGFTLAATETKGWQTDHRQALATMLAA